MESTVQSPRETAVRAAAPGWIVVIAHHPDAAQVGRWRVVAPGERLALGRRGDALGAGALDDDTLSREHVRLHATGAELRVEDAGSRNGTWVNGARVEQAALRPGDVVELGALLLQVVTPPAAPAPVDEPELRALSGAMGEVVAEVRRLAARPVPVVFAGETGVGKSALAALLHRWSGRGRLEVVRCAALAQELARAELHGVTGAAYPGAVARDGALARADGGTLVLDGLDDAAPSVQAALRGLLEEPGLRPVGAGDGGRPLDVRLVATVRAAGRLLPELAARVEQVVVRVPPLRDRVEDVGVLVRERFARAGRVPSKRLVLALLRHGWPLNAGELDAAVERACLESADGAEAVALGPALAAQLGVGDGGGDGARLAIAADGSWLRPIGGGMISLRRRENLGLLLRALVAARRERPGRALELAELFRAGWPEQRIDARAAAGRVYVALTSLRNLGLREVLLRRDDGYLLDPDAAVELID